MSSTAESPAYLAAIVASSDDAIVSKDLNGNITSWNPAAEKLFGYDAGEMVGRHITTIIPPDKLDDEEKIIASLKRGERIDHFETVRRHKDGHLIPVSLTISPIYNANGTIIGASKIARDISEKLQIEKKLHALSIRQDEFLANISHELRTPMNAVVGIANLLENMPLPDKAIKLVETLKISADNMMELINDLLDSSRLESDMLDIDEQEFNLIEQIEKVVKLTSIKAREKHLPLHVDYGTLRSARYIGDALRIRQILVNLLSNAVKFTEQGSVTLYITSANSSVIFRIRDTGIGIPRNKLEVVFEKFTQADSSISRRYGGSGLGLTIVKALVDKMRGTVKVESEEGLGATFTVTLPLQAAENGPIKPPAHLAETPPRKNVLLVEDYKPNIIVAEVMLQDIGCDYDIAHNGFEAMKQFLYRQYDVILMDVQMHDLDGLEATRRIRILESERGLPRTPVVAMTAHTHEQDRKKCLDAGMDGFISKPFSPAELSRIVLHYVQRTPNATFSAPHLVSTV